MKIIIYLGILFVTINHTFAQTTFNFESWTGVEPNDWTTFNSIPGVPQTTFKETVNPAQGSTSVKLKTAACPSCGSFFLSDPLPGIVSLGPDLGGIPFTQKPLSISFKYKSIPVATDQGGVLIQLTKWNAGTQSSDVIGEAWFISGNNVSSWTSVTLPVTYMSSLIPDTLIIEAFSSLGSSIMLIPNIPTPVVGSEFYIDAINIVLPSCSGFSVSVSGTNESSPLASDGSVTANAAGGTAPYTYLWNTSATTPSINGLMPGLYDVSVTDANGCIKTSNFNVLKGGCNNLTAIISATPATSFGSNNGSAIAIVTGGTAPYTYTWFNGETTSSLSGLDIGVYSVFVTDATGNCHQWAFYPQISNPVTAIETYQWAKNILVSPNPSNGIFNIESDHTLQSVKVINALGQTIIHEEINATSQSINLNNQNKGLYFYIIENKEGKLKSGNIILE